MRLVLSRHGVPEFLTAGVLAFGCLSALPVAAQEAGGPATIRGSALEYFDPSGADGKLLASPETRAVDGHTLTARTVVSYARTTTIYSRDLEQDDETPRRTSLVSQFSTVLGVSLATQALRINLDLPVTLGQGFDDGRLIDFVMTRTAPGDARLGLSVEAVSQSGARPSVALLGKLWAPTGNRAALNSSGRVRYGLGLALSADYDGFGYRAAISRREQGDQPLVDSDVAWSAGVFAKLSQFQLGLETWGSSVVNHKKPVFEPKRTHAELLLSAFIDLSGWRLGLAAGPGLGEGIGTPSFRGLATLQIPLTQSLETQPPVEPPASFLTNARRTIHLGPYLPVGGQPVEPSSLARTKGSAPAPPAEASAADSETKTDASQVNVGSNASDDQQTSDTDSPPELAPKVDCSTLSTGDPRPDHCPPLVVVSGRQISVRERIRFEMGRDTIDAASYPLLEEVKAAIQSHPEVARVAVDGHTDNVGRVVSNLALSRSRALAVARWLIKAGVDERRIEVRGFGPKRPLATNDTEEGRAKNRRVEFTIIRNDARGKAAWSDGNIEPNAEAAPERTNTEP